MFNSQVQSMRGASFSSGLKAQQTLTYKVKSSSKQIRGRQQFKNINAVSSAKENIIPREKVFTDDPINNITEMIYERLQSELHKQPAHPLCIIKDAIYEYFNSLQDTNFQTYDGMSPVCGVQSCFDDVLIPPEHVSRRPNDTYYVSENVVLRPHTTAHQAELLRAGETQYLVTGDVYRRDEVDSTHYPVFHQMEGVKVFEPSQWEASGLSAEEFVSKDLKATLEGLARHLFGDVEIRWVDEYFPFTDPSYEMEIYYNDEWMEILGCGVMKQEILDTNFKPGYKAWAFGLGLERWAMKLFQIPDIRLFWSSDQRFLTQFSAKNTTTTFEPFSKHPPVFKDIAFYIPETFAPNDMFEIVRGVGGDLVEKVELTDEFFNKKLEKTSHCYRVSYRSMERALTNEEINVLNEEMRGVMEKELGVELR